MPITKKQEDVPGALEPDAALQAQIDDLEKRLAQLKAQQAGNIPQVSSAPLHNYPEATYPAPPPEQEQERPQQPQTGAAAVAEEH
jgi:hypothetical protein